MRATDWQQHSVRGFPAGVVRSRLKLKLRSKKVDARRIYQTAVAENGNSGAANRDTVEATPETPSFAPILSCFKKTGRVKTRLPGRMKLNINGRVCYWSRSVP